MTLRNEYKQKTPMLRDAEDRAMPIYVLKSNTIPQMQSSLTSIFSLEIDPREAAMRETEDAIESVLSSSEAGRAVAAERLHPAAPAPDGRAGEPRLAVARPRAVPPGPALSGRGPQRLAVTGPPRPGLHRPLGGRHRPRRGPPADRPGHPGAGRPAPPRRAGPGARAPARHRRRAHLAPALGPPRRAVAARPRARHADLRARPAPGPWMRGAGFSDVREMAVGEAVDDRAASGRRAVPAVHSGYRPPLGPDRAAARVRRARQPDGLLRRRHRPVRRDGPRSASRSTSR